MESIDSTAAELLAALPGLRVACVGDVMLDRYVYGTVDRISPEAPIPVLHVRREDYMPGGAGNVARNLSALGARTSLVGVRGDDREGHVLGDLLAAAGVDCRLIALPGRRTTSKWRFVAASQQLLRADWEDVSTLPGPGGSELLAAVHEEMGRAGALVLSDYGKGMLDEGLLRAAIDSAAGRGIPVVVDPKGTDYARYRGASVVTPNKAELSLAAGGARTDSDEEVVEAARRVLDQAGLGAVLATRGPKGMVIVRPDRPPEFLRSSGQEVFDVSGAGDTVVAVLGAGLAAGMDLAACAALANVAAGVVVSKLGTSAVSPQELRDGCRASARTQARSKVMSREQAAQAAARWRDEGKRVGFTNGCFDLLHPGHVHLLEQARARCDRLIVAINSDASVARLKGEGRPVQDTGARATVLGSLESVDAVTVFDEDTPLAAIEALRPDVLVKGADYTRESVVGHELVESWGGEVFLAELKTGFSTSGTVARMTGPGARSGR